MLIISWLLIIFLGFFSIFWRKKALELNLKLTNGEISYELKLRELELQKQFLDDKIIELKSDLDVKNSELLELKNSFKLQLETSLKENMSSLESSLKSHYEAQNKILFLQNKEVISKDSKKILDEIFNPIEQKIKGYTKSLDENSGSLETQLKRMFEYSQSIGQKADNLALILKGDKKIRGNFGELKLRQILESSGLQQGSQYIMQESFVLQNESGNDAKFIPDAIVYINDGRGVVIDSKFSMPDLEFGEHQSSSSLISEQIAKNLKSRIDELAKKPYADIRMENFKAFGYVLLFVPYQNVLDLALHYDSSLFSYAESRQVYLTSPQTLLIALKVINMSWINENRNKNVAKMLDLMDGFKKELVRIINGFDGLKRDIEGVSKRYLELHYNLHEKRGNLLRRLDQLDSNKIIEDKNILELEN